MNVYILRNTLILIRYYMFVFLFTNKTIYVNYFGDNYE